MTLDGNVKIKCSSLLCVIFYLPLQISLVASLHILGYLEENSESFLCENWVHTRRVLMGLPNSQLTTIFLAKYQLTAIFLANSQLTTNFG